MRKAILSQVEKDVRLGGVGGGIFPSSSVTNPTIGSIAVLAAWAAASYNLFSCSMTSVSLIALSTSVNDLDELEGGTGPTTCCALKVPPLPSCLSPLVLLTPAVPKADFLKALFVKLNGQT